MTTTSLSVALCTYNGARFLPEQLASLVSQSRLPDELVVCDDCSSDATREIVERFRRHAPFPVRTYWNASTMGVSANFGQAIEFCQGELIALCDQDDIWKPAKLDKLCSALERQPDAGYAFSDAELVDAGGNRLRRTMWDGNVHRNLLQRGFPQEQQVPTLLKCNIVTGAAMVFRAYLRPRIVPISGQWIHDYWIASVASLTGAYGIAVPMPLLLYRQHGAQVVGGSRTILRRMSVSRQRTPEDWKARVQAWRALQERVQTLGLTGSREMEMLSEKLAHLSARSALHCSGMRRKLVAVLSEIRTGRYCQFSNSWQSVIDDVVF